MKAYIKFRKKGQCLKKKIIIDGMPLCDVHSGMQRFMVESLTRLDAMLDIKELKVEIIYPSNREIHIPELCNIKIKSIPYFPKIYRYIVLPLYIKWNRGIYCNMANGEPVKKGSIICLHDINTLSPIFGFSKKEIDERVKRFEKIKKKSKVLVTVSETSKAQICDYMQVPKEKVKVICNGWEHMDKIVKDNGIFEKYPQLKVKEYIYSLGSIMPHKNFKWIKEVAKRNPNLIFAIAGNMHKLGNQEMVSASNILYLGRVTDEENKALMERCRIFVFPSKLEGFGIPPLEALACGAKIAISRASCLPEIYGECAVYFDPDDYEVNIEDLEKQAIVGVDKLLEKYSWKKTAKDWYEIFLAAVST